MKIENVLIENFRGIKGKLELALEKQSVIIFGENGSGKSSIIDAFEFCLKGEIQNSNDFSSSILPEIINCEDNNNYAKAEVVFDDGSLFNRNIKT